MSDKKADVTGAGTVPRGLDMAPFPKSRGQVLITGLYRTGSEYLCALLSGQPQISTTMYHVNAIRFILGRYGDLADKPSLDRALSDLAARLAQRYDIVLDTTSVRAQMEERRDEAALYDAAMTILWLGNGPKTIWAEKCQLAWREIPWFLESMPNGRAIHLQRDPRAVLTSFKAYTMAPAPGYLGAIFNCLDSMARAKQYREVLPLDRYLVVRYEDFAREPRREVSRICTFLGVSDAFDPVDGSRWRNAYGGTWTVNSAYQGEGKFDVERAVNGWRQHLSDAETALTEHVCGPIMQEFGYTLDGTTAPFDEIARLFINDETICGHVRDWLNEGIGIQAFPLDPVRPENWDWRHTIKMRESQPSRPSTRIIRRWQ